ncbi:MAG: DUF29 domain-containing protein [Leptolyngbyaceae cyanobacterium RM2_2_4]|nr:DUF29 domain-containing protein [Leptolyngbyaceae cyanobacterium SM1_4_3]NJN90853.1 DUF29 domain-containing protein [Leptolyngbyaceae cyanobacterium SL_5_14]NJO51386.1 DUF29 domain-containing protein [Leptolyngbyaceae cyanobacterium RM2_2_4]NJO66442.1 DUF29 domain-containing protein [Leptolyngbyaceae cyanobacterium RM1_405_57]
MKPEVNVKSASLYDIDYQLWLEQTVIQLRSHDFSHLDLGVQAPGSSGGCTSTVPKWTLAADGQQSKLQ